MSHANENVNYVALHYIKNQNQNYILWKYYQKQNYVTGQSRYAKLR